MKLFKKILILFFLISSNYVMAQDFKHISLRTKKSPLPYGLSYNVVASEPEVGLALSGGGARGIAQIGVIKALEEAGIRFSLIAGTSIGSIIGGAYASGYSSEEIDSIVMSTDWNNLIAINNPSERRELFIDQKISEDRSLFTLRLDGFSPVLPTSFNEGLRLSNYLTLLCLSAPVLPGQNFDDLLFRYRAVCTSLVEGIPVIISEGSLARAMRASSSVTFLLSPIIIDSTALVDGGLVSNIPVSVVSEMGADYVIAINTTSSLRGEKELEAPWNIADQTVSIPMKRLADIELSKADFHIRPEINNWSLSDFNNLDSLILAGYLYAKEIVPQIKSQIDSLTLINSSAQEFWLKNIKIADDTIAVLQSLIKKYSSLDSVSSHEIYLDLIQIYNHGIFDSLSIGIEQTDNSTNVSFNYTLTPLINEIEILSPGVLDSSASTFLYRSLVGKPFNGRIIFDTLRKLIIDCKRRGFVLFNVEGYDFDLANGRLKIEFDAGVISQIFINSKSNQTIIEREFGLMPGDVLFFKEIEDGLTKIRATGLFDDISLSIEKSDNGFHLYLNVNEKISRLLKVGFLVDNTYNAQLGIDIRDVNLFYTGTELGLFLFGGTSNRAYILEHISYRILNTYLTYKLSAYYKFNDINVYNQTTSKTGNTFSTEYVGKYRQIFYGGALSVGAQLEKFGKLIFTGKYQYDVVKNKEGNIVNPYETKIVSLKVEAIIDDQNRYPYPEDGLYFNGAYETAQSFLGGDEGYLLVSANLKYFFKLAAQHVFSPKILIGFGDKTLPLSEQFMLGGLYSFFGAHENEFRGRQVLLTSLMYQYKLPFKIFFDTYTWFRYDLGSTWAVQEQIRFKDLRHGVGGAISFDTPIGPADFALGRSFIISQGLTANSFIWGDVLFYFSIGHAINF